jgi:phage terminase large subunit GpA-like protein
MNTPSAPFASARDLARDGIQLLAPPTRETVDEYAAQHRLLPRKSGNGVQLLSHDEAPYMVAPERCLTSHLHLTTAIVGPAQCGKTGGGENWLLHMVEKQPRNFLWYMQTDEGVEAYVKKIINPMIDRQPVMRSRLGDRPEDDSLHFKRFAGMAGEFLSFTDSNLINKNAPCIIADEWDAYDTSIGDPKTLLDRRRQYYGRMSMLLAMSHADLARGLDPSKHWNDGIMKLYADSDRRVWYWPCPQCSAWSSPAPWSKRVMTLNYDANDTLDQIEKRAHLLCPVNGCVVEDKHRRAMNLAAFHAPFGGWIGDGQEIAEDGTVTGELIRRDTAGFAIQGVMSLFLLNGIGGLARDWEKEKRAFAVGGDDTTLKQYTVKALGYPYASQGPQGSIDAETLAERAIGETWWAAPEDLRIVPEGVRFLTCWLDIQLAHFEVLVRGWGVDSESWVIDKYRVPAETTTDGAAWLKLLEELIARRYPLATDLKRGMAIRALGYDSGGAQGTSDRANETWSALRARGLARNYGTLDGRDVWSIIPTKGASTPNAPRLQITYPDNQRKERKRPGGTVPLARFNANSFKDSLAAQLMHAEAGPSFVHLPKALRSKESPHINFEQLVSERRDVVGRWTKPHQGVRNEMLDLMVGNHVLAWLHGLGRINWQAPPPWSASWDVNVMISAVGEVAIADMQGPKIQRRTIGEMMKKRDNP